MFIQFTTMTRSLYSYIFIGIAAAAVLAGCSKDKDLAHAPGQPMTISDYTPTVGGLATEVLITGDNFSSDTSEIIVTINGNRCAIVNANTKQIMALVPRKCGSGKLVVKIGKDSVVSSSDFNYIFTSKVTTYAGNGKAGFANGVGKDAMFSFNGQEWYRSMGIDVDDDGNVYVADPGNACIRKIDTTGMVSVLAGSPGNSGFAEGKGAAARFNLPYGLAVGKDGNIYTVDPVNYDVRKITPDGMATVLAWAQQPPWEVAVDKRNNDLYYTSVDGGKVWRVKDGQQTDVISDLSWPAGIGIDKAGNIYVACNGSNVIARFKADTYEKSIIAGQDGSAGYVNGPGASAKFASPWGLGVDNDGNIYVAGNGTWNGSTSNPDQSIRFIEANTWIVKTLAGSGAAGYTEGTGEAAAFSSPNGVAIDKKGVAYVIDKNNNCIRKIVTE